MIFNKYQKFDLKNKIIATLVGFVLIISGLIYFIVVPTVKDIKTRGGAIEEQVIDLEKKYIRGNSLRQLTENLKKIEPRLSSLDQIFINKNRELEFITTLENKANETQISQKINLSPPNTAENIEFQKNSLQLFTNGEFTKQLKYLIKLESLNYYINIKSLELSSSPRGGQTAPSIKNSDRETSASEQEPSNINLSITADTYWK